MPSLNNKTSLWVSFKSQFSSTTRPVTSISVQRSVAELVVMSDHTRNGLSYIQLIRYSPYHKYVRSYGRFNTKKHHQKRLEIVSRKSTPKFGMTAIRNNTNFRHSIYHNRWLGRYAQNIYDGYCDWCMYLAIIGKQPRGSVWNHFFATVYKPGSDRHC